MPTIFRQVFIIVLLALIPAIGSALFHPKRPDWKPEPLAEGEMMLADIKRWKDKPLWVDARSKTNYEKGHIPGAVLLNEDHWDDLLPAVLGAWKPEQSVVVYCDSKRCDSSKQVAVRLRDTGLGAVFVLKDGWEAWQAEKK